MRKSARPIFSDWAREPDATADMSFEVVQKTWRRVGHAVLVDCAWLSARLPSYRLNRGWPTGGGFEACAFTRMARDDEGRRS